MTAAATPTKTAAATGAPPTVRIVSPADGATLTTSDATIQVDVGSLQLVAAPAATSPNQYHVHYLLDIDQATLDSYVSGAAALPTGNPNIVHTTALTDTFQGLSVGQHTVTVLLTGPDHRAIQGFPHPSVTFSFKPTLKVIQPALNSTITGSDVTVQIDDGGLKLVPGPQATNLNDLHIHYMLDVDPTALAGYLNGSVAVPTGNPNIVHSASTSNKFTNVQPGVHTVTILMTNKDHKAIQPPVEASVTFDVRKAVALQPLPDMPGAARYELGVAYANGLIYVVGGHDGINPVTTVQAFDTSAGAWRSPAPAAMTVARQDLGVAAWGNGQVYAIGGFNGTQYLSTVEVYNPSANTWTTKQDMPTARSQMGIVEANGKIYVIGGANASGPQRMTAPLKTVEEYDPSADRWTLSPRADMPTARSGLAAVSINGIVYAIGGDDVANHPLKTVEAYDPSTDKWSPRADMPGALETFAAAGAANGIIYVVGVPAAGSAGTPTPGTPTAKAQPNAVVYEYNPATDSWSSDVLTSASNRVYGAAATANNQLYVFGDFGKGVKTLAVATLPPASPLVLTPGPRATSAGAPTAAAGATSAPSAQATTGAQSTPLAQAAPGQVVQATATTATTAAGVGAPAAGATPPPATAVPAPTASVQEGALGAASSGLPVWAIAAAGILLLAIVGGLAYFFLGRRRAERQPVAPPASGGQTNPGMNGASPLAPPGPTSGHSLGTLAAPGVPGLPASPGTQPQGAPVDPTGIGLPRRPGTPPPASTPWASGGPPGVPPSIPAGYQIVSEPKIGGMAAVYKAYQAALDRYVAMKVILPQFLQEPTLIQRFYEEARRTAKLDHPNIVTVYDVGQLSTGSLFIVMRWINGPTLEELISREGWLPVSRAVLITSAVAGALDYAHQRGVFHRDIKPSNIMIEPGDRVTLTDFGIATLWGGSGLTRPGSMMGTPRYMSPEEAMGRPVDHRSDIYSLGVVLYEMLTGQPPFQAETEAGAVYAHLTLPARPPRDLNSAIPEAVEAVILKALSKDPAERQQSAHQLRAELEKARSAAA